MLVWPIMWGELLTLPCPGLPLLDMDLTTLQLFVGATVGLFYVPCIAVIATLTREYGIRMALAMLLFTTIGAFLLGGVITRLGGLFYG